MTVPALITPLNLLEYGVRITNLTSLGQTPMLGLLKGAHKDTGELW